MTSSTGNLGHGEREREARTAAELANRAKDEFMAMLGHELRRARPWRDL